jgi:hypothetical protein
MGSLSIFTALWFFKLPFVAILYNLNKVFGICKKPLDFFVRQMFFNEIISLLIDACFEFLISAYLQIRNPLETTVGE